MEPTNIHNAKLLEAAKAMPSRRSAMRSSTSPSSRWVLCEAISMASEELISGELSERGMVSPVSTRCTAFDQNSRTCRWSAPTAAVEAEGQAKANQILSASLTPALKEIKLAELQRDAALAIANKAGNTVLLGGGAQPLVNVGK